MEVLEVNDSCFHPGLSVIISEGVLWAISLAWNMYFYPREKVWKRVNNVLGVYIGHVKTSEISERFLRDNFNLSIVLFIPADVY